jgi:serine/threonine protein kinase/tetratricopeptide (TPR) repeat protein
MPHVSPSLDTIFTGAIEIGDAAARAAYVARACASDHALRRRVEALVAAHFRAGNFLERPAEAPDRTAAFPRTPGDIPGGPGDAIGPYKLLERVGEGGMGVVYVAEQTDPVRRRVALKVIKPGMDTKEVVSRFEAERQALALMDHPHIAKVLDAGATAAGLPFFVMELVRGLPITDYCDQARLPADRRLRLFVRVCRAVQHAHQKGVIHRDLKPANVLVTLHDGEPAPKVIDFGVAKAVNQQLTAKTVYTRLTQLIGTPLYMAPEQAELSGLDIDTRSDVYSLGVLLYELLTGTTPFDVETLRKAGFDEMRRMIREDEPPRPSARISTLDARARSTAAGKRGLDDRQFGRMLRGDVDWMVMKALEKDRNRRYESAGAFAADVERYLAGKPVEARPPSAAYRVWKFVRRNKARLAVGLTTFVAQAVVAAGVGYVAWDRAAQLTAIRQGVTETLAAARAAVEAGDLALAGKRVAEADGQLGADRHRLPDAAEAIEGLRREVADRGADSARLRQFLTLAADAQDKLGYGNHLGGDRTAEEALALYGVLTAEDWLIRLEGSFLSAAQKEQARETVYMTLVSLADVHIRWAHRTNDPQAVPRSLDLLRRAEAFHAPTRAFYFVRSECRRAQQKTAAADDDRERLKKAPARTAWDHYLPGHTAGWRGDIDEAIRSYRAALAVQPDHYNSMFFLAHRLGERKKEYAEAAGLFTGCIALKPGHLFAYTNRAEMYQKLGRWDAAEADLAAALAVAPDDNDRRYVYELRRDFYHARGQEEKGWDEHAKATALIEKVVERRKAAHGPNHPETLDAMTVLGVAYSTGGRPADAIPLHEFVLARRSERPGPGHADTTQSMHNLACGYHQAGQTRRAIPLFESTLALLTKAHGPNHATTLNTTYGLAVALQSAGRTAEAIPLLERVRDGRQAELGADHEDAQDAMHELAHAYQNVGRVVDAVPLFRQTFTAAVAAHGPDHPVTLKQMGCLASAGQEAGELDEAERLLPDLIVRRQAQAGPKSFDTALAQALLGTNLLLQKRPADAEPVLRECLATRAQIIPDAWPRFNTMSLLGDALLGQGRYAEAEPLLLQGYEGMKQRKADIPPAGKKRLPEAVERIVRLYETTGQPKKAGVWRQKLPSAGAKSP